MADIKRLLRKKSWTGEEIGQIEIANIAYIFAQQKEGKNPKPLIEENELHRMKNSISDPEQGKAYNRYINLYKWLGMNYNITSAQEQQAQSNFKTIMNYITVAIAIEKTYDYIDKLPVIMTTKQYNDFIDNRKDEIINTNEGKQYNLFRLMIDALDCLIKQIKSNPSIDSPLNKMKANLQKQLVSDKHILSQYNEVNGIGYYTLDDTGERSDQMTEEEWNKARISPKILKLLGKQEDDQEAITTISNMLRRDTKDENLLDMFYSFTKLLNKARFDKGSDAVLEIYDSVYRPSTFHPYDSAPDNLTKWEILENGNLEDYYPSLVAEDAEGNDIDGAALTSALTEEIMAFKDEFPEVFSFLQEDMRKYLGDIVDTALESWANTYVGWKKLYDIDYYDFRENNVGNDDIFKGNYRAIDNGIAILQDADQYKGSLDENGYYKSPKIMDNLLPLSLNAFFPDAKNYADKEEEITSTRKTLINSFAYMIGFNKAIDMIEKEYKIPMMDVFKFNCEAMARRIEELNNVTAILYRDIAARIGDSVNKELQQKKLDVLKNFFSPIECDKIAIPPANIKKAKAMLVDGTAFIDANLTDLLCIQQ